MYRSMQELLVRFEPSSNCGVGPLSENVPELKPQLSPKIDSLEGEPSLYNVAPPSALEADRSEEVPEIKTLMPNYVSLGGEPVISSPDIPVPPLTLYQQPTSLPSELGEHVVPSSLEFQSLDISKHANYATLSNISVIFGVICFCLC